MIVISAMGETNRVIGRQGGLPWSIPDEYRMFLQFVRGNVVLMGRTSYEIFGPDLTESQLVVVSRSVTSLEGADVCPDVPTAVEQARSYGRTVFSAGGASIYRQTIPLADTLYLSLIKGDFEGDAFFPELVAEEWRLKRSEDHPEFEFRVYDRAS
jgi:dihydrofolate reductase